MSHNNLKFLPYCYLIAWPEQQKYYYGVKFGQGAHPNRFWVDYFTSSTLVTQYRDQFGDPSLIQIRKVFDPLYYGSDSAAQEAAVKFETTVLRRMSIIQDRNFLNCSNNVGNRTGDRITNHTQYRLEKYGQYFSDEGLVRIKQHNRKFSRENNPMHNSDVRARHLDSIARKIGYSSHCEYVEIIKEAFKKYKTIKVTAEETGHSQYAVRHLLLRNFGSEWVESIREVGLIEARARQKANAINRKKIDTAGKLNPNAYVWEAISPTGEITILYGNRISFCKEIGISSSLDPNKQHLRKNWEFNKLCKVRDYN